MPANVEPIFPLTQQLGIKTLTTADTSYTAPTTAGQVVLTGAANGTRVDCLKVNALGTNIASLLRVFVNDGLGTAAANFNLMHEVVLPASTSSQTAIAATPILLMPINYDGAGGGVLPPYLKSGQKIYVSIGTAVATGWAVAAFGGDY